MGSSSDAEPMREGEAGIDSFQEPVERKDFFPAFLPFQKKGILFGQKTLVVFKQIQCWAKPCQPVIAEVIKGGDREEEIKDSHSTP